NMLNVRCAFGRIFALATIALLAGAPVSRAQPIDPTSVTTARGPLARLVNNPDARDGLPPFALADQFGNIQRFVEPIPGVDLAPYVGQIVVVRYDTGRILLASQLELPALPLQPLIETASGAA